MYPHNGHPSAAGRAQDRVSSPAKDRRSAHCATQPTMMMVWRCQLCPFYARRFVCHRPSFNRCSCINSLTCIACLPDIGNLFHCELFRIFFALTMMENAAVAKAESRPRKASGLCHAMPARNACLLMQINGKRVTSVGRQLPSPFALGYTQLFC